MEFFAYNCIIRLCHCILLVNKFNLIETFKLSIMQKHTYFILTFICITFLSSCQKKQDPEPENQSSAFKSTTSNQLTIQSSQLIQDAYVISFSEAADKSFYQEPKLLALSWKDFYWDYDAFHQDYIFIRFDYSALPTGTAVGKATVTLYADTTTNFARPRFTPEYGHHVDNSNINLVLSEVTRGWGDSIITYYNRPVGSINAISLPAPVTKSQAYTFDVTAIVNDQLINGNYGFEIALSEFTGENRWSFYSSEGPYPHLSPKIVLEY
jgi:hypothetical protein